MKSFSDHRSKYVLLYIEQSKCRVWLCHCQPGVLTEECHQSPEDFMDLKSLELGLTALKGHYATQALGNWFIHLQLQQSNFLCCLLLENCKGSHCVS